MIIKKPNISDFHYNDLVTIKPDCVDVECKPSYYKHQNGRCTLWGSDKTNHKIRWNNEPVMYTVREININDNTITIYGFTTTEYHNRNWTNDFYLSEMVTIPISSVDTLYSNTPNNEFEMDVLNSFQKFINEHENKLSEFIPQKYLNLSTEHASDFESNSLSDFINQGCGCNNNTGFYNEVDDYFKRFLTWGDYIDKSIDYRRYIVWNPYVISVENVEESDEYIKEHIGYMLESFTTIFDDINKALSCDLISYDYWGYKQCDDDDYKIIKNGLEQYYSWIVSIFSKLVKSNVDIVFNKHIDGEIEKCNNRIKSFEQQIEILFREIDNEANKITELKTQYKLT